MDKKIEKIEAKKILDSREENSIEVSIYSEGSKGSFALPSGKSKGSHEAVTRSVEDAIQSIDFLDRELRSFPLSKQKNLDEKLLSLDGSEDKSHFGANALLGVSVAYAKLSADTEKKEIHEYLREIAPLSSYKKTPRLYINLINGGEHAESPLAFQEYHVVPHTDNVREALKSAQSIQQELENLVREEFGEIRIGDEGGFVLSTDDIEKPLQLIQEAIRKSGLKIEIELSLDVAASSFHKDGKYFIGEREYTRNEMVNLYKKLIEKYNIFSIEDPLEEEDFEGFRIFREETGIKSVGDDLTVTNRALIERAINSRSIDAVIIKPNQIGTLSETLEAMKIAQENKLDCIVSHRSGETKDTFIADLAWAFGCEGLKAGAPNQEERRVKYERLCEIQEHK